MTNGPFTKQYWDAENRLIKAEVTPTIYYSFTYDGLNRRIGAKFTNQGVVSDSRYLWCGEQICQKRSNTDTVTGRYFDEGEVVVSSGLKAYYAKDHLGSVRDDWGLYEMHGNVWEWCADWYGDYPSESVTNPKGATDGTSRVLRGGSWIDLAWYARSAFRSNDAPDYGLDHIGFRFALGQTAS